MLVWILIIIGSVLLDQISKLLIAAFLSRDESLVVIDGIFRFTYVENRGAAFGMMDEHRWIFMVLSVVGIVAIFVYLWKFRPQSRFACVALSFIVGGGIGNMIDRVRLGYVIDFIDFYPFPNLWVWVFNVADSFVCVGAGMLIVYLLIDLVKEFRLAKT
ncbi:MAG: signal peptidase II, partial [Clostridia bacterium]|nr:signal peptidase II [Clostridia bacterium]